MVAVHWASGVPVPLPWSRTLVRDARIREHPDVLAKVVLLSQGKGQVPEQNISPPKIQHP